MYTYKPKRFYFQVFIATWSFWLIAIIFDEGAYLSPGNVSWPYKSCKHRNYYSFYFKKPGTKKRF